MGCLSAILRLLTYAKQIEVYKYNNSLLYVLSSAKPNAAGQRWVDKLAEFNINVHYKPRRYNLMPALQIAFQKILKNILSPTRMKYFQK